MNLRWSLVAAIAVLGLAAEVRAQENLDLFLLIGQSNMSGRGAVEAQDKVPIPHVYSLDRNLAWVPAIDPIQLEKLSGVSLGRSFARELLRHQAGAQIGLIPAAVGATSLGQWMKGGGLFENAVKRAQAALAHGKLRGILWHQGEGDGQIEGDALTYNVRWLQMIADFRRELNAPDVPVVVGELCRSIYHRKDGKTKFAIEVNEQLAMLPLFASHCAFVSSEGLNDRGDQVHFDSAAQRELGRRYAHAFLELEPTWDRP